MTNTSHHYFCCLYFLFLYNDYHIPIREEEILQHRRREHINNMSTVEKSVVESSASSSYTKQQQCSSSSIISSQKVKLILPELTPAMQQDLALVKTGTEPLKPLSIANRPEYEDYPLVNIVTPHPHDVCKCIYYALNVII